MPKGKRSALGVASQAGQSISASRYPFDSNRRLHNEPLHLASAMFKEGHHITPPSMSGVRMLLPRAFRWNARR
jgi:hypothetical protein